MPTSGSPVGSTPFGLATPVAAPEPSLAGPALSRYINPGSGDYEIDTTVGQFAKMPVTRQRVLLIAKTELGSSSALPTLGIDRPRKLDEAAEFKLRAAIQKAYYRLTTVEQVIAITNISFERLSNGRIGWTMEWIDLTALTPDEFNQSFTGTL